MKVTMDLRSIAKYHKLLDQDNPPSIESISKALNTTVETLKRFTPEAIAAAKAKQAKKQSKDAEETQKKAQEAIVKTAETIVSKSKSKE